MKKLIDKAMDTIINGIVSSRQIQELEAIKIQLVREYAKQLLSWTTQKKNYDLLRPQLYIAYKKDGEKRTDKDCEQLAKMWAEIKYWDYDEILAKARWYKAIIDSIGTAVISFQSERKREWQTEYTANTK